MFRNIPDEEAVATVEAAWKQGIRYFDTAPFYGSGLSERRLGKILAKHNRNEYVLSSKVARVDRIKTLATRYEIPLKAAGLQFSLAHPASAAVIPGASRPERIAEDHAALAAVIPANFWYELREHRLVSPNAPLPIDGNESVEHGLLTVVSGDRI
jgi:aryl-alcohol dehydrogenase-like predicted oxidoreductase